MSIPTWRGTAEETLGAHGQRTKESIVAYVKGNSPLGPNGKRALASALWLQEQAYRRGFLYDMSESLPYPRD